MKTSSIRKGAWTAEEDLLLRKCIQKYGEGKWHQVPLKAGLNRCRKSCRLRWLNYLHPNIKRGEFKEDEIDLILKMHKLLGNRWSLIAGRLHGRTANDVKNYWNSHLKKKSESVQLEVPKLIASPEPEKHQVFRPQPRAFSSNTVLHGLFMSKNQETQQHEHQQKSKKKKKKCSEEETEWWNDLLVDSNEHVLVIDNGNGEFITDFTMGNIVEAMGDQEKMMFGNSSTTRWESVVSTDFWLMDE